MDSSKITVRELREILKEKGLPVHYKQKIELVKRLQQYLTVSEKIDLEMSDEEADTQQNKLPPIMYPQQPMQYICTCHQFH